MSDRRVTVERVGHVLHMGLNRPTDRNFFDFQMLQELADAYGRLDREDDLRAGVLYGHGPDFCAGLELADMVNRADETGLHFVGPGGLDPWQVGGVRMRKPVITAVQGAVITLAVELVLVSDVVVADTTAEFAQLEASRGVLPFGGSTIRFPRSAGWGNSMRWSLTGDRFDAVEAYRMGLVQEVVQPGEALARAAAIAENIASNPPLAVQAVLASARLSLREGEAAAEATLQTEFVRLSRTRDVKIATKAFENAQTPFNDGPKPDFLGR